jgi:nitronate monooxygenase
VRSNEISTIRGLPAPIADVCDIFSSTGSAMSSWPDRRFIDLVGSEHPIIAAPMANAGGTDLCIAAIQGGALGSLPCGMLGPGQMRDQTLSVRARVAGPLNLNFFCHRMPEPVDDRAWRALLLPYYEELGLAEPPSAPLRRPFDDDACAAVEDLAPEVVSFHFGLPAEKLLDRVKASGAAVIANATTVEEALFLEQRGADAVIAQGWEAGGHSGRFLDSDPAEALTLFALLPQIVEAVDVPVIAAGGIFDGRGIAAAFALGASAVQVGSAYLHCPESLLAAQQRAMIKESPTVVTNVYSGGLARAVRGRLIDEIGPIRGEAPPYPLAGAVTMPLFRAAMERGDFDLLGPLAGQSATLGQAMPAEELTRALAAEALAILNRNA